MQYDDDVLIAAMKIILIITAVGSQMHNLLCYNYIHALAGERINFESDCHAC